MSNDANGFEMFVENGSAAGGSSAAGSGGAAGAARGVCADFERASSTGTSSADGGKSGNARAAEGRAPCPETCNVCSYLFSSAPSAFGYVHSGKFCPSADDQELH